MRTAAGPRHETVAYLGKLEEGEERRQYGWSDLDALLEGRAPDVQLHLDLPGMPAEPEWRRINVRGVRVQRVRAFGRVWAALSVWRRLGLHRLLRQAIPSGQEDVSLDLVACILATARFCAQTSELSVAPLCVCASAQNRRSHWLAGWQSWVSISRKHHNNSKM
jgi:hypothetical protein